MEQVIDEGTTPFPVEESGPVELTPVEPAGPLEASLGSVRDLILDSHADLVPDLVRGETLAELMDSIGPAREAYARLVERLRSVAPVVPAGGTGISVEEGSGDVLIKRAIRLSRGGE